MTGPDPGTGGARRGTQAAAKRDDARLRTRWPLHVAVIGPDRALG